MALQTPVIFLLDKETDFVFDSLRNGNRFILSNEEWEGINKNSLHSGAIVILAELSWGDNMQSDFYGFTIGMELRRKYKCILPIIITSSLSKSHFEILSETELKYNLLYARGTTFLPLLSIINTLSGYIESLRPISLALLADMNEMLFNLQGVLVDNLSHRLRSVLNRSDLARLMLEMKSLLNEEQIITTNWDIYHADLQGSLGNELHFFNVKTAFINTIKISISSAGLDVSNENFQKKHHILIVEDDSVFADTMLINLEKYFNQVTLTNNADEAIEILKADTTNSIVGLVCDWRLYEGENSKYWQKQGYEILEYAAKNKYAALFGITSLADTNVHSIRNLLGFEIHLFKKEHFDAKIPVIQWKIMADIILQKCNTILYLIAAEPSSAGWKNIRNEYILQRNSGWANFENDISFESYKLYNFYIDAIERNEARNVFSINEMGISLKKNLRNILISRRVFFGIYCFLNKSNEFLQEISPASLLGNGEKVDTSQRHHGIDAYAIMRKDWWDDVQSSIGSAEVSVEWDRLDQRIKNFRNVLGIDLNDLPRKGLLPEEKAWMYSNGIDFSFLYYYWEG